MVQRMATNGTTSDNKWQLGIILAKLPFLRIIMVLVWVSLKRTGDSEQV